jgi:hypothetical protein
MKEISYRGYRIVATGPKEGGIWRSRASITLPGGRRVHLHNQETIFGSKDDAEQDGLRLGQHWVNNRLQRSQQVPNAAVKTKGS